MLFGRLGVPLTGARLEHGDRRRLLLEAASRVHERPDGTRVELSARTIEDWYYDWRRGGFRALFPQDREGRGKSRAIPAELAEHILRAKRERPRHSIRRYALAQRILNFQRHYQAIARPFEWRFTRDDLAALLRKLDCSPLAA